MRTSKILIVAIIVFASMTARLVFASTSIFMTAPAASLSVGGTITANVRIGSDVVVNAAQGTIYYPANILSVDSVNITNSIFNIWLTPPSVNTSTGVISFLGGSTNAYSGAALPVFDITFRALHAGAAVVQFQDAAITAGDGTGANIIASSTPLTIVVGGAQQATTGAPQALPSASTVIAPPTQISRPAAPASGLPAAPVVNIPLYPSSTSWYAVSSPFFAAWSLPPDVTDVATALDSSPATVPAVSEGLFESKEFPALPNGTSYIHVRFKNSIGWGATTNYRVKIDTLPPSPFMIQTSDSTSTDDPTPPISWTGGDELAGINYYKILIDGQEFSTTTAMKASPGPLTPGMHRIVVEADDNAGNATQASIVFDILPIASPSITSLTQTVYVGEGGLVAGGTTLPGTTILAAIKDGAGNTVLSGTYVPDASGNWTARIDQFLKQGNYRLEVTARDARGAESLAVTSGPISVTERPVLVIGSFQVTLAWFTGGLVISILLAIAVGLLIGRHSRRERKDRIIIAARDVGVAFGLIQKDIGKLLSYYEAGPIQETQLQEMQFILKRIEENLAKMKHYVSENVEEIG
jgi:hypothetical protein